MLEKEGAGAEVAAEPEDWMGLKPLWMLVGATKPLGCARALMPPKAGAVGEP